MLLAMARDGKPDPRAIFEQARGMEAEAHELEGQAIRLALERCHGMVGTAAAMLGIDRGSLRNLFRGRHRALGAYALELRQKAGYETGRPPADLRVEEGDDV